MARNSAITSNDSHTGMDGAGPWRERTAAGRVLRAICLLAAFTNIGGNALLLAFHREVFGWLAVPPPRDLYTLACVSGLSLNVGVGALLVYLDPPRSTRLLFVCALAKLTFALISFSFFVCGECGWHWMVIGGADAAFAIAFALYLIHLCQPGLVALNTHAPWNRSADDADGADGDAGAGGGEPVPEPVPGGRHALLLSYSLTGSAGRAIDEVAHGLAEGGYSCHTVAAVPVEDDLFRFPFRSRLAFLWIMVRAILRIPAKIEELPIREPGGEGEGPDTDDYDLVVCACQTWMAGVAAPFEAVFSDPAAQAAIRGRDVALVNVSRGSWQRSQAMVANHVRRLGGRVIATSAHEGQGRDPWRLIALFWMLVTGVQSRWLPPVRPSDESFGSLRRFGAWLARREPGASVDESGDRRARGRGGRA